MIKALLISLFLMSFVKPSEFEQRWDEVKDGHTLAWARHKTGYNEDDKFKSAAVIPGSSEKTCGDARHDSEVWVIVDRGDLGTFVECFQAQDWGTDQDYAWHVDAGVGDKSVWVPPVPEVCEAYPFITACSACGYDPGDTPADGALTNPTTITTHQQLMAVTGSGDYTLANDIDLNGITWTPIAGFSGTFEGNNYTVSNLDITTSSSHQGLFRDLDVGAEIRNLNLTNCSVRGTDTLGILAGRLDGTVTIKNITATNCSIHLVDAGLTLEKRVGGMVGDCNGNYWRFWDCAVANLAITTDAVMGCGLKRVGGFVGEASGSSCYFIRCAVEGGSITPSYSMGSTGGFVGYAYQYPTFSYCTTSIAIIADIDIAIQQTGGFAGIGSRVGFYDCNSTGSINIETTVGSSSIWAIGGLVGEENSCTFSYTYSTSDITLTSSHVSGSISYVGGLLGRTSYGGGFICSYSEGDIVINNSNIVGGIGGLIGQTKASTLYNRPAIYRCWSESDITIADSTQSSGYPGVGGLIGSVRQYGFRSVNDCYAKGTITDSGGTSLYFGGLIGRTENLSMANTVTNCYATGGDGITDGTDTGGLIGIIVGADVTCPSCYWDTDTSGLSTSACGTGATTAEMADRDLFDGWNFDTIWDIKCTPEMPGYWAETGYDYLEGASVCVYADGKPVGNYTVVNGDLDGFDESLYTTIIVGINYYSTYESFPLELGNETNIHNVTIDFYETLGCNVGVSRDNSENWLFSEDDFATKLDLVTDFKDAPLFWGTNKEPVAFLWLWEPIPLCFRNIIIDMEVEID